MLKPGTACSLVPSDRLWAVEDRRAELVASAELEERTSLMVPDRFSIMLLVAFCRRPISSR